MFAKLVKYGQWLCGSVGRVVASDTRGPGFESGHWQKIINIEHLFTVNWVLKSQKYKKEAGNGLIFLKKEKKYCRYSNWLKIVM